MVFPVTHLDHCSVVITDIAAARSFYGGKLGLREIPAPAAFDFIAIWYDLGGTYLHLLLKPEADTISPRHFCLHVSDIDRARRVAVDAGIPTAETVKIPGAERFFIRDPDGNRIEVLQWVTAYDPVRDGLYQV